MIVRKDKCRLKRFRRFARKDQLMLWSLLTYMNPAVARLSQIGSGRAVSPVG